MPKPSAEYRQSPKSTFCRVSSHSFAKSVTHTLLPYLADHIKGHINITAYTPPFEERYYPDGFLELNILPRKQHAPEVSIGIIFGQHTEEGLIIRKLPNPEKMLDAPQNPLSTLLYAANFDEAWRIVCLLGNTLQAADVNISYGY